jgi:hypothetical protein
VALPPDTIKSDAEKRANRDAKQQDALLREVDEAYRTDVLAGFAKNHGIKLGALVIGALALFGGYLLWSGYTEGQKEESSEQLVKAIDNLEAGNFDTASKSLLQLEKEGEPAAAAVAKMARAAVALQQQRPADAAKLYGQIAADTDMPAAYRDLALIRQVSLDYETMKPSDVVAKMKPLAKPGEPYFGSAGELLGAAYLDLGKPDLAGPLFAQIAKDEDVPASLRSRARQLAGLMGIDAIVDVDETLKEMRRDGEGEAAPAAAR